MGQGADDAYELAERQYLEFLSHEGGNCGRGDCEFCNDPGLAEMIREGLKQGGPGL